MRLYRVENLSFQEHATLQQRLDAMQCGAGLDNMYWLPVPEHFLSSLQRAHVSTCGPYGISVELSHDAVQMEFLVRSRVVLRCECIHYASAALCMHMMQLLNTLLEESDASPTTH